MALALYWPTRKTRRLFLATAIVLSILSYYKPKISVVKVPGSAEREKPQRCLHALQQDVAIIVKTGTSEAYEKLPMQLQTTLSCVENLLIVSDLDADFAGYHLHDVLHTVNESLRAKHPAFDIYHAQRRLSEEGWTLQQMSHALDPNSPSRNAAWELDKFKFTHAVMLAHRELPNLKWYVFMEADTYMVLPNLLRWLRQLDHQKKLFIGSPDHIIQDGFKFNHGGPGFVLSGPAIRTFAVDHPGLASTWDQRAANRCCGDYVLSLALHELGIPVSGVWPMLSGERPLQLPFGPRLWCEPVISLHHVTPADVFEMWNFEEEFDSAKTPILFRDVFYHWLPNGLPHRRGGWENSVPDSICGIQSDIHSAEVTSSFEACSSACDKNPRCMQFLYQEGRECTLYSCFTLGAPITVSDEPLWEAGWKTDRINAWISSPQAECTSPTWVPHSTANARSGGFGAHVKF